MISAERKTTYLKPHQKEGVQRAVNGQIDFEEFAIQHGCGAARRLQNLSRDINRDPRLPIEFSFERSEICEPDCEQQSSACDTDISRRADDEVDGEKIIGETRPAACFFYISTGKNH